MKIKLAWILIFTAVFAACGPKKSSKSATEDAEAILNLRTADRLLNQKRCVDATTSYQAFLTKFPKDADARNKLGLSYMCEGKPELAISEFQAVLVANPSFTDVHNNLGVAYIMTKNYPEAQKEFRIALQDTTYPVTGPYFNLAKLAYMQGSYEESRALAKKVMELLPKEAGPRLIYSQSLAKLDRDDEAIASFYELLKIAPDNLDANYYLAELWMKKNKPCDARIFYAKVIDIDPIGDIGQKSIAVLKGIKCPK